MGLKSNGCYATIWEVRPQPSGKSASVRLSISKKNQASGEYETDFSGFVRFAGKAFEKINTIGEKSRVKITEFDVTNKYDYEKKVANTSVTIWDFEPPAGARPATTTASAPAATAAATPAAAPVADELPF